MEIIENRGKKPIYDFNGMELNEHRSFKTSPQILLNCAKWFSKKRKLNWKFRCYTNEGLTFIVRVK